MSLEKILNDSKKDVSMTLDELLKGRKKPGPKARPKSELAKRHTHSFPPEISRFLSSLDYPGLFIKTLIKESNPYKKYME